MGFELRFSDKEVTAWGGCGVPRFHRTVTQYLIIRFWMFKAAIATLASYDFHDATAFAS